MMFSVNPRPLRADRRHEEEPEPETKCVYFLDPKANPNTPRGLAGYRWPTRKCILHPSARIDTNPITTYKSMVATKPIKSNETILVEQPLFAFSGFPQNTPFAHYAQYVIRGNHDLELAIPLSQLSPRRDDAVMIEVVEKLRAKGRRPDFATRAARFLRKLQANAYSTADTTILFEKMSFINHSCSNSNALSVLDGDNVLISVMSTRDIAAGEEITICYPGNLR